MKPTRRLDLQVRLSSRLRHQLSLQTPLSDQSNLSLIARQDEQLLQVGQRLTPGSQVGLQLRFKAATPATPASRALFLQLSLSMDHGLQWSVSGQRRSDGRQAISASLQRRSPGPEGERLQLDQQQDEALSQSLSLQAGRRFGDLSLVASRRVQRQGRRSEQVQASGQFTSRLWITEEGFDWGPIGQTNLVIHRLGLISPGMDMRQGEDLHRAVDESGTIRFSRTPSWTLARYQLNPKTLPFWLTWRGGALALPLASQRAYRVDLSGHWQASISLQLSLKPAQITQLESVTDARGRSVHWLPDGFVDLPDSRHLPLRLRFSSGASLTCGKSNQAPDATGHLLLDCQPQATSPRLATANEGHVGRHEGHELNVGL